MNAQELMARIASPSSDAVFARLYGETAVAANRARYLALAADTLAAFGEAASDLRVFTAAGRTELGGNHTDHNRGKVLAAAIQLDAIAFVSARADSKVVFRSPRYPDVIVDLDELARRPDEEGSTEALVRGIAAEFAARGIAVRGFTANAVSTVLSGSGLSSSAAIEVLIGTIFNELYAGGRLGPVELAQIGQKAENVYFGKPSGLMDQVACAFGGAVAIDFADPAHPLVRNVDFDLEASGWALCVVDTGGSHADLTADYAAVPAEMKEVAREFGVEVLRGIDRAALVSRSPSLRATTGDRALLRAFHFFAENDRVDGMLAALERANAAGTDAAARATAVEDFLRLVAASGDSSWRLLQNISTPRLPGEQGVALALALTEEFLRAESGDGGFKGVCRVHGGGFAGTIQAYIRSDRVSAYVRWMGGAFGEKSVTQLRIRPVGAAELRF